MEKKCRICDKTKPLESFHKKKGNRDGHRTDCKNCRAIHDKVNFSYDKTRDRYKKLDDAYIKSSIRAAICRARSKGYTNYDSHEDLFNYLKGIGGVPDKCPILNIKLEYGSGDKSTSPSLDRIDVTKGYVVGNIWFISNKANTMKSNASFKELIRFAKFIIKNFTYKGMRKRR